MREERGGEDKVLRKNDNVFDKILHLDLILTRCCTCTEGLQF